VSMIDDRFMCLT